MVVLYRVGHKLDETIVVVYNKHVRQRLLLRAELHKRNDGGNEPDLASWTPEIGGASGVTGHRFGMVGATSVETKPYHQKVAAGRNWQRTLQKLRARVGGLPAHGLATEPQE